MAGRGNADADLRWLREAIELSRRCPPSDAAFSVGAVLVSSAGEAIATGFSRERDPRDHAEEVVLAKAAESGLTGAGLAGAGLAGEDWPGAGLADAGLAHAGLADAGLAAGARLVGAQLAGATLYTSLEPCLRRLSRPRSCAQLIVAAGIRRVVLAWREPPVFVPGGGARWLRDQGVTVVEVPELADAARAVNAHLLPA